MDGPARPDPGNGLTSRRRQRGVLLTILLTCSASAAWAEDRAVPESRETTGERRELTRAERRQLAKRFMEIFGPVYGRGEAQGREVANAPGSGIPDGEPLIFDIRVDGMILLNPLETEKFGTGFKTRLAEFNPRAGIPHCV